MNKFGEESLRQLRSADWDLQQIAFEVLAIKDHSILKGHRTENEQNAAFHSGNSKLLWPNGKHNAEPSMAIDVQTYPRPPLDPHGDQLRDEQYYLLGLYVGVAAMRDVELVTGADWDSDGEVSDNGWDDLFHVELK